MDRVHALLPKPPPQPLHVSEIEIDDTQQGGPPSSHAGSENAASMRPQSLPALSVIIPRASSSEAGPGDEGMTATDRDAHDDSISPTVASSICGSPSWERTSQKSSRKKTKEEAKKRKKEKDRLEKQAKAALRGNRKLSKRPPSSPKHNGGLSGRSSSTPATSTVPRLVNHIGTSLASPSSRQGSFDDQQQSYNTSSDSRDSIHCLEHANEPILGSFIGGVKLSQANTETVIHTFHLQPDDVAASDSVYERDIITNAYHLTLTDTSEPGQDALTLLESAPVEPIVDEGGTENQGEESRNQTSYAARIAQVSREYGNTGENIRGSLLAEANNEADRTKRDRSPAAYRYPGFIRPRRGGAVPQEKIIAALETDLASVRSVTSQSTPARSMKHGLHGSTTSNYLSSVAEARRPSSSASTLVDPMSDHGKATSRGRPLSLQARGPTTLLKQADGLNLRRGQADHTPILKASVSQHLSEYGEVDDIGHLTDQESHYALLMEQRSATLYGDKQSTSPTSPTLSIASHYGWRSPGIESPPTPIVIDYKAFRTPAEKLSYTMEDLEVNIVPPRSDHTLISSESQHRNTETSRISDKSQSYSGSGLAAATLEYDHLARSSHSSFTLTDTSEEPVYLGDLSNITTPIGSRPQSVQIDNTTPAPLTSRLTKPRNDLVLMSGARSPGFSRDGTVDRESVVAAADVSTNDERQANPIVFSRPFEDEAGGNTLHPSIEASDSEKRAEVERRTSVARLQTLPVLHDLSFLPELKHQALVRPPKKIVLGSQREDLRSPRSLNPSSDDDDGAISSTYLRDARLSVPRASTLVKPSSSRRSSSENSNLVVRPSPLGKFFVICCGCKLWHDLPTSVYEAISTPASTVQDADLGVSGSLSTLIKCPWCMHAMSTSCCAGYAAEVTMRERFH